MCVVCGVCYSASGVCASVRGRLCLLARVGVSCRPELPFFRVGIGLKNGERLPSPDFGIYEVNL
jgi:hypothetical protein